MPRDAVSRTANVELPVRQQIAGTHLLPVRCPRVLLRIHRTYAVLIGTYQNMYDNIGIINIERTQYDTNIINLQKRSNLMGKSFQLF